MVRPSKPAAPLNPEDALRSGYSLALRWLSMREYAGARIRSKLAGKGFTPAVIDTIVEQLTASRAIDDDRAVRACARTLVAVKLRGRQRAQRELEAMGFASELARRTLAETLGDADERALANRVLISRLRGAKVIADPSVYRRLYGALLRKGFSPSVVRDALKPYWKRGAARPETGDDD